MTTEEKTAGHQCDEHQVGRPRPAVRFKIDCEPIEVHTDHLTLKEILDLVDADPSKHYIVELGDPENIPHTNLEESIPLRDCDEFITVFTGETPVS
jgi:hypothetical protein